MRADFSLIRTQALVCLRQVKSGLRQATRGTILPAEIFPLDSLYTYPTPAKKRLEWPPSARCLVFSYFRNSVWIFGNFQSLTLAAQ